MASSADRCSQGSGEWTLDSAEQASSTFSSASRTSGDAGSSPATGRVSPPTTTYVMSLQDVRGMDKDQNGLGVSADGLAYTLDKTGSQGVAFLPENQRGELMLTPYARQITGGGGKPGQGYPAVLISSQEDSPARTCPSPADAQDSSTGPAAACSSSSPGSLTLWSDPEDGSSLRTFPDSFPQTTEGISPSFSRRWPTSGSTTSPGECWTHDTSECPSAGGASSSLPDVLEENVPARYFLSRRAAAGILRRATKRGRELPPELEATLRELAGAL